MYVAVLMVWWLLWSGPLTALALELSRMQELQTPVCSRWETSRLPGLFQDGDVVIGGLFSVYIKSPALDHNYTQLPLYKSCSSLKALPLQYVYAMLFALEEINHSTDLLPGIRLGFLVHDSCGAPLWALRAALSLMGGNSSTCNPEYSARGRTGKIPLVIGGDSSQISQILSRLLGPFSVPLMSYSASCPCLSDRRQFPNFFRTMPSDIYQARVIAQLAIHYGWTWIGAVVVDNAYGLTALKIFQQEIQGKGVCLAFVETLQRQNIISDARRAAITIQASTAKVILIFLWYTDVGELFHQLAQRNVTGRQFIASETWSTSGDLLQNPTTYKVASGVIGVAIRSSPIPGFEKYLRKLNPSHRPHDMFLREFWQKTFLCRPKVIPQANTISPDYSLPPCSGTESLELVHDLFTDTSQLRVTYNIYLAVYAAAHALHSLFSCSNSDGHPANNSTTCSLPRDINPMEVLQHLRTVNFTTPQGERFYFDGGDVPAAKYDLMNWQKTSGEKLKLVLIARVDGLDLKLKKTAIQWSTGTNQVPVSLCSLRCPPGTRKATKKGEPVCCFDCIPCTDGEISNTSDSPHCQPCPLEFWSNPKRTACIPRQLDFLSYNETLGITLTTVAVSGAVVTTAVLMVFLYFRQTPMVRANNSELSFLLLVSLKLCFLCSLVFIGRPSVWSCRFQQAAFGISFVLSISCLLVKTMVVLAAFRSARPGAESLMRWFGPSQQRGSVCFFTTIQILICAVWLASSPPVPQYDMGFQGSKVTLRCAMASVVGFSLVLCYIGLLGCSCLLMAFYTRKLPDNFNEAKLITFSMLIFCAVWMAFVPAYVSSPGKYAVAVEIFAILASSYGLLFCIFAPKCFIILLRPEKNTKKHLMAR